MKTNSEILATFNCPETLTDAVKEPVKRLVKAEPRKCDNCKRDGETCTYQEIPKARVCGNWIPKPVAVKPLPMFYKWDDPQEAVDYINKLNQRFELLAQRVEALEKK